MAVHIDVSGTLRVAAPPGEAFRFFTPEGERRYVPGWDPEYLHPSDGALVEGLTFRTTHGGEQTIWLVSAYDPGGGAVDYVRVTPDSRIGTVAIRLAPARAGDGSRDDAATDVTVTYRLTSLSSAGDLKLAAFEASFPQQMASWERAIGALLSRSG
jgi:hypothetical protein